MSFLASDPEWKSLLLVAGAGALVGAVTTLLFCKKSGPRNEPGKPSAAPTPMKVYHHYVHRSSRVTWFIEETGTQDDFEIVDYDPYNVTEERKEWYKANVHPHGTVPALVTSDGAKMIEVAGIVFYLADLYQRLLPPLCERHNYYSWSVHAVATLDHCIRILYRQLYVVPKEERDKVLLEHRSRKYDEFAVAFENHLRDRDYVCGNQFTAADICVGYSVMWASIIQGGVMIQDYPRTKAYLARLKKRPAFQKEIGTARDWLTSLPPLSPSD